MGGRAALIAMLLVMLNHLAVASDSDCGALLKEYHQFSSTVFNRQQPAAEEAHSILYVLRPPGTSSAELDQCLLRPGLPASKRCPDFSKSFEDQTVQVNDDVLIAAQTQHKCSMMSSREDMSIMQHLPASTAVAAHLKDPLERFVSAYELAVEVAAKKLKDERSGENPYIKPSKPHPQELWPFNQLGSLLLKDMKKREEQLELKELEEVAAPGKWVKTYDSEGTVTYTHTDTEDEKAELTQEEQQDLLPDLDPYDNELVMPLKEFVQHPKVLQLLHNGELLHVLGLTNVSRWSKAKEMRSCIRNDAAVAGELFEFATKQLQKFAHVGLSDDLHSSLELAAAELDRPLTGPAYVAGNVHIPGVRRLKVMSFGEQPTANSKAPPIEEVAIPIFPLATIEEMKAIIKEKEAEEEKAAEFAKEVVNAKPRSNAAIRMARRTVDILKGVGIQLKYDIEQLEKQQANSDFDKALDATLGAEVATCMAQLRGIAAKNTTDLLSLLQMPDGRQIKFTEKARQAIPAEVVGEIRRLNALDVKLYDFAKQLVQTRHEAAERQGKLQRLQSLTTAAAHSGAVETTATAEA